MPKYNSQTLIYLHKDSNLSSSCDLDSLADEVVKSLKDNDELVDAANDYIKAKRLFEALIQNIGISLD